jgi:tRNA(adenine34) deaminase
MTSLASRRQRLSGNKVFSEQDSFWMEKALALAKKAESEAEVPVGAVLVLNQEVIGAGSNRPIRTLDPTAHAETVALREGAKTLGNYRLLNTTLYVTLEPCLMCTGALIQARIARLVFGASDPKAGAIQTVCHGLDFPSNHRVAYAGGLMAEECGALLTAFFRSKR